MKSQKSSVKEESVKDENEQLEEQNGDIVNSEGGSDRWRITDNNKQTSDGSLTEKLTKMLLRDEERAIRNRRNPLQKNKL